MGYYDFYLRSENSWYQGYTLPQWRRNPPNPQSNSNWKTKRREDTLEKPHEIDHWVYFGEENEQKAFIELVKNSGFKILSAKYNEGNNPESRYVLNFSREDHIEHIEEIVSDLIELALQFNGHYDGWGCNIITE